MKKRGFVKKNFDEKLIFVKVRVPAGNHRPMKSQEMSLVSKKGGEIPGKYSPSSSGYHKKLKSFIKIFELIRKQIWEKNSQTLAFRNFYTSFLSLK